MTEPVKRRTYSSAIRKEQADATRTRILEAASELFLSDGYARATIKQIADRAQVAADTVYATFKSKGRILTALIDLHLTSGASIGNVLDRPEGQAIRTAPDQREQVAAYVELMRTVMADVAPIYDIMRTAAVVDEEMAAIYGEMQGYRAINTKRVAEWIAEKGALRMPVDEAGDVIWGVSAPELASMMIGRRGWSIERYWGWVEDTLVRVLLPAT